MKKDIRRFRIIIASKIKYIQPSDNRQDHQANKPHNLKIFNLYKINKAAISFIFYPITILKTLNFYNKIDHNKFFKVNKIIN